VSTDPSGEEPSGGRLRPTSAASLTAWGVLGLVGGWLLHRVMESWRGSAPVVTWTKPLALFLGAAIVGAAAWSTWRTVHVHRQRLEPHRAVNRLVLARACAYVGALVAGGYAGYAISWLGVPSDLASQRAWRSLAAAIAGVAILIAALLLERACRVRNEDEET